MHGYFGTGVRRFLLDWELEQHFGLLTVLYDLSGVGSWEDRILWRGSGKGRFDVSSFYTALVSRGAVCER